MQKYPGKFEVIIVDNASKDETQKICKKYAKKKLIKYYRSPVEYDRKAFTLDEAIKKVARYDILAMTDPDGVCREDWLMHIVQPFKDKHVGGVIGLTHAGNFYKNFFTKLRAIEDEWGLVISPLGRSRLGRAIHLVCGANYAVRRSALKSVGYHGKKTLGEDFELTIRLYKKGWRIRVTNAEVWQEEVENLREYVRQRLRWMDTGIRCNKLYAKDLAYVAKRRFMGLFLFYLSSIIQLFSFIFMVMMLFGAFFSIFLYFSGLISFILLNLGVAIGLAKFDKRHLIPYVPFFLLLEPFYAFYCLFLLLWHSTIHKRPIVWRSLYDGYYHRGSKVMLK